jgi:hypothetical protein
MTSVSVSAAAAPVRLGLRENLGQFSLLVLINAFVGGMVGRAATSGATGVLASKSR